MARVDEGINEGSSSNTTRYVFLVMSVPTSTVGTRVMGIYDSAHAAGRAIIVSDSLLSCYMSVHKVEPGY